MGLAPRSLRTRLVVLVISTVVAVWAAAAVGTYVAARQKVDALLDAHLAQSLALLVAQAGEDLEEFDTEHAGAAGPVSNAVAFQIWDHGQRLALHSANAPDAPLGDGHAGFSDRTIAGVRWRVYSAWDHEGEYLVHVGERVDARTAILHDLLDAAVTPLVIAVPVLALLAWIAVHRGVRPVARVADEVSRRDPARLDALPVGDAPTELVPLLDRLNGLFADVTRAMATERRFTADAAHELRTPLAAIRTQAQVALGARDGTEREAVLRKVMAGCDRAARLVDQLLTLARVDSIPGDPAEPVDLGRLTAEAVADAAPDALTRGIEIALTGDETVAMAGHPGLLRILLRNLVDNAVRYTPDGGEVRVELDRTGDRVRLAVLDSGPGIPAEVRPHVWERFYRVPGSRAEGSGLGLSIVARICEVHGGTAVVEAGIGGTGTGVVITFPDRTDPSVA